MLIEAGRNLPSRIVDAPHNEETIAGQCVPFVCGVHELLIKGKPSEQSGLFEIDPKKTAGAVGVFGEAVYRDQFNIIRKLTRVQ